MLLEFSGIKLSVFSLNLAPTTVTIVSVGC
jgi:hypothetical protein